jgi:hypothetical protein
LEMLGESMKSLVICFSLRIKPTAPRLASLLRAEELGTTVGKGTTARLLRIGVLQNYWTVKEMVRLVPAVPVADLFVYGVPVRVCPPVDSVPAL